MDLRALNKAIKHIIQWKVLRGQLKQQNIPSVAHEKYIFRIEHRRRKILYMPFCISKWYLVLDLPLNYVR